MTWTSTQLRENAITSLRTERGENYNITAKRFGMWMINDFLTTETRTTGISKTHANTSNRYTISPMLLMEYLQARGWWIDF
jgi:hypothetical protein